MLVGVTQNVRCERGRSLFGSCEEQRVQKAAEAADGRVGCRAGIAVKNVPMGHVCLGLADRRHGAGDTAWCTRPLEWGEEIPAEETSDPLGPRTHRAAVVGLGLLLLVAGVEQAAAGWTEQSHGGETGL